MANPVHKFADYDDILALPENMVGEIINGRLEVHPRPAPKHALTSSALGIEIGSLFHGKHGDSGGWWILDEPECHIGGHVLVPDLAGWRKHRMPQLPDTAWFEVVPDWVCEILSPNTAKIDRSEKMPIYSESGVSHLWLIDPVLQTLETYQLHEGHWLLQQSLKDVDEVCAQPFAEHTFLLSNLWE